MKIMGLGIDDDTGNPLIPPIDEETFFDRIHLSYQRNASEIQELSRAALEGSSFRGEMERTPTEDLTDPLAAGWTFLVNASDQRLPEILEAVQPLARHRGMVDPSSPLLYHGETYDAWFDWMAANYSPLILEKVPLYVLIVGGPDQVPFAFQSMLNTSAAVGRVSFDTIAELNTYIEKVIRLEKAAEPAATRSAIFFAPDYGQDDPTYFSRRFLVEPLIQWTRDRAAFPTTALLGEDATKQALEQALRGSQPALVFTASHGLIVSRIKVDRQKRLNGAICCQRTGSTQPAASWLYAAEDVPAGEPFLEGSAFFQFACFGYGTPAESDYMHWLFQPELNAQADFIAALPRRLLALPRGPMAYIGHVDTAWLHGFDDPNQPRITEQWHPRIAPFMKAVEELLKRRPPGLAMREMSKRYDLSNAQLTTTFDLIERGRLKLDDSLKRRLAGWFITRSDAQNYMVFGDPAAQLRISQP